MKTPNISKSGATIKAFQPLRFVISITLEPPELPDMVRLKCEPFEANECFPTWACYLNLEDITGFATKLLESLGRKT